MSNDLDIFKIKTNNIAPQKGRILIAEPFLPGDYFNRSVILLVAHSNKGAVGFILNKKVDFPIQEVFPDFPEFDTQVYLGGPVSTDSIYFIHKLGDKLKGSIRVLDNLYWGGDFEELKRQITIGLLKPSDVRFFLGYSGWEAGQLEQEIKEDSWLVTDIDEEIVMRELNQASWVDFVKKAGDRYSVWENFPENPSLN
ncbi:MAG: YqgE/AlgH family protein [Prolixibacteraceae bacterium]|jgi:putative transcriptional regulator|nr:YqgE/AlgH family protein [Prolixibacteraceae bacterium]MBT6006799.1 YqgE/AlgH family protein [Prolixibacteraceae bacterium]MBT6765787.1 YqgE/AlgH family protein [Prolixibacteraceae bacterium]MBT6997204.1 YqgE/AlgH family protein [Prolixibacteraceae bacterium]MBT7393751.1 YqgE/AlgH family protein [Prolixibacteraceae bacterium]